MILVLSIETTNLPPHQLVYCLKVDLLYQFYRKLSMLQMLGDLLKFILVREIFYFVLWVT
jgi:hypothetical protein